MIILSSWAVAVVPLHQDLVSATPAQPPGPTQEPSTNGSATLTWNGLGLTSPGELHPSDIQTTVDGPTVVDPTFASYTSSNPPAGMIGLAICPAEANAAKTGLSVIQSLGGGMYTFNM